MVLSPHDWNCQIWVIGVDGWSIIFAVKSGQKLKVLLTVHIGLRRINDMSMTRFDYQHISFHLWFVLFLKSTTVSL
jgi:hypothetical protein